MSRDIKPSVKIFLFHENSGILTSVTSIHRNPPTSKDPIWEKCAPCSHMGLIVFFFFFWPWTKRYWSPRRVLKSLPNKSSCGKDQISYQMMKEAGPGLVGPLVSLFAAAMSIRLRQVPDEWRKAIITPIFKGGRKDRRDPTGYRPIALTPCVARVMEKILNGRIFDYLEKKLAYLWTSIRISTKSFNSTALLFSSPIAHGYGWGSQYPIGVFWSEQGVSVAESQSADCWANFR